MLQASKTPWKKRKKKKRNKLKEKHNIRYIHPKPTSTNLAHQENIDYGNAHRLNISYKGVSFRSLIPANLYIQYPNDVFFKCVGALESF